MTRQKKELIRKMDDINNFIYADMELGCGCTPAHAYDELYEEIDRLGEELAHLCHYASYNDYIWDNRDVFHDCEDDLPFM